MNEAIEGEVWAYIGRRKTGKTTLMMEDTIDIPAELLYVKEYHGNRWEQSGRNVHAALTKKMSKEQFIEMMMTAKNCAFVVEDATPYFQGRISEDFLYALSRSREEGVSIFMAFHSFRKTPNDIFDMVNGIVIFKTADKEKRITDRTDDDYIMDVFKDVRDNPSNHYHRRINFYQ